MIRRSVFHTILFGYPHTIITIYCRHRIGQDGYLDHADVYDISELAPG